MIYDTKALYANLLRLAKQNFYRVLEVDIDEFLYYNILDTDSEKPLSLLSWVNEFVDKGNIHPEDIVDFLEFFNTQKIKQTLNEHKVYRLFYRRLVNNEWRHTCMEIIPLSNYDFNNPIVLLIVRDVQDYVNDFRHQEKTRSI